MKRGESEMNYLDEYVKQKKAIGKRFKQFRELVGKSQKEMEQEANDPLIMTERINMFEHGAISPDIIFMQYFTEEYGLNLTWLVKGSGFIFSKKGAKIPEHIYNLLHDTEPSDHFIKEIILLNQQSKPGEFPNQKPQNWKEIDGSMMW
jgi:transcriptional regulator with XRE-family HTH domain